MTRGNFVIIKDKKIYMSWQFNGDMYPEWHGKIVYELLKYVHSLNDLEKAIRGFDNYVFEYFTAYEETNIIIEERNLDFSKDYFSRFNSDYLYIKNLDSEPYEIISRHYEKHEIQPGDIEVWYFGDYEQPKAIEEDLKLDAKDKELVAEIKEKYDLTPAKKVVCLKCAKNIHSDEIPNLYMVYYHNDYPGFFVKAQSECEAVQIVFDTVKEHVNDFYNIDLSNFLDIGYYSAEIATMDDIAESLEYKEDFEIRRYENNVIALQEKAK